MTQQFSPDVATTTFASNEIFKSTQTLEFTVETIYWRFISFLLQVTIKIELRFSYQSLDFSLKLICIESLAGCHVTLRERPDFNHSQFYTKC